MNWGRDWKGEGKKVLERHFFKVAPEAKNGLHAAVSYFEYEVVS